MKKFLSMFMAVVTCLTVVATPAMAATAEDNLPEVIPAVSRALALLDGTTLADAMTAARTTTVNLGDEDGDIDMDVGASKTVYSPNYYKTNTQQIKIKLKSSNDITVKVSLYDTSGNYIGGETKDVGTILNKTWTFSNLTSSKTYYFTVKNLGQRDVTIKGSVTD